jgi:hypothetical protein
MSKSLSVGDFGAGRCDKCDKELEDLVSLTFGDDATTADPITYTFCQDCLENAVGDAVNEGKETQMLSERASNDE